MTYNRIKKYFWIPLCVGIFVVGGGAVHAQTFSDPATAVAQALATLKDEEARLMAMRQSTPPTDPQTLVQEEKTFLNDVVQVLVKRDAQLQQEIASRPDIFSIDDAQVLTGQIDLNKSKFDEFSTAINTASSTDALKQVAHDMYLYRTSQEVVINRPILSAYLDYFGSSVLQSVINRYQQTQNAISALKNAGQDVSTLQPMVDGISLAIAQVNVSFLTLKNKVGNDPNAHSTSFESDLLALQNAIKAIYAQFRQLAIEGGGLLGVPVTQDTTSSTTSSPLIAPSPVATSSVQ